MQNLESEWGWAVVGWAGVAAALAASIHVVLRKRDSRAAVLWIGLIWLSPFVGAIIYVLMGVNRIRPQAKALRGRAEPGGALATPAQERSGRSGLGRLGDTITGVPAVAGNRVTPLVNGEQAYPAMLQAIHQAKKSITLATYIFDVDPVGLTFADALEAAVKRGVQVRVLIDDIGARYSWRKMHRILARRGVPVARFLPLFRPRSLLFINLRLHRKLMIVDGKLGFTGGMNIRAGHEVTRGLRGSVRDMHFQIEGPVVSEMQKVFADDWQFTTGESLNPSVWFDHPQTKGSVLVRCVEDGPDLHLENARWILLGALSEARQCVRIMTPYFVPDSGLITALNAAALRGVRVQILLPGQNNLPWVHWASQGLLWQVVEKSCEVYFAPPPFDHSKLMTIDDSWTFFGSINWDARSLRLNFELNLEAFDTEFTESINALIDDRIRSARQITLKYLDERKFAVRLRDGVARLFAPYL